MNMNRAEYEQNRDRFIRAWVVAYVKQQLSQEGLDIDDKLLYTLIQDGMKKGADEWERAVFGPNNEVR